jgi:hypothetical protein
MFYVVMFLSIVILFKLIVFSHRIFIILNCLYLLNKYLIFIVFNIILSFKIIFQNHIYYSSTLNLYIYGYNGTKKVNATVKVGNYALYGTETPAFKVKKDGEGYAVSIWNGSQYETTTLSDTVVEEPEDNQES